MDSSLHINVRLELQPPCDLGVAHPSYLVFAAADAHQDKLQGGSRPCVEYPPLIATGETAGWSQPIGLERRSVGFALSEREQPAESVWPYGPNGPTPPAPPTNLGPLLCCTPEAPDLPELVAISIANRVPVFLVLEISKLWYTNLESEYAIDDMPGDSSQKSSTGHAVREVGIGGEDVGGSALLVQTSWGERWADSGCAWLSRGYIGGHLLSGTTVGELL